MKVPRIFIKEWLELKPYENHSITDNYYLKLTNEVNEILFLEYGEILEDYIYQEGISRLSCLLASYFEDVISLTNVFGAFTTKHHELYGKWLPFFDTTDYYQEEINVQDVQFLIWYFLDTIQKDKFLDPHREVFSIMAADIMIVFDDHYETAPENKVLKKYYTRPENETDFYLNREMIDTVLFKTYLFETDTAEFLSDLEIEILKRAYDDDDDYDDDNLMSYLNENRDWYMFAAKTKLLSLSGNEWVAEIIGEKHPFHKDFKNISPKIKGYFLYKGQDDKNVFIEHIASGKKFDLTKKSLDDSHLFNEIDSIIYIGIVQWREEWWFSGMFFIKKFDADFILDEKNSIESRKTVAFLDHQDDKVVKTLQMQMDGFLDYNNGKQIAFMPADKVNDFRKGYMEFFNNSLNLSEKQKEEAKERIRKEGFLGGKEGNELIDYDANFESALVFFNPKSGVEIAFEVNSAFPFKENKFFNEQETQDHVLRLFMADELSTELAMFCVDNFKDTLPFFKDEKVGGMLLLNDLDFILRFFKSNEYHTKPQITYTGEVE